MREEGGGGVEVGLGGMPIRSSDGEVRVHGRRGIDRATARLEGWPQVLTRQW